MCACMPCRSGRARAPYQRARRCHIGSCECMLRRRAGALVHVHPLRLPNLNEAGLCSLGVQLRLRVTYTNECACLRVFSLHANAQLSFILELHCFYFTFTLPTRQG